MAFLFFVGSILWKNSRKNIEMRHKTWYNVNNDRYEKGYKDELRDLYFL